MSGHHHHHGEAKKAAEQLQAAMEIMEAAAKNRALLSGLTDAEHTRLMKAAGDLYCPDLGQRRRLVKAKVKQRKAEKQQRDDSKLYMRRSIRKCAAKKFSRRRTCFRRKIFRSRRSTDNPDFREVAEPPELLHICKQDYSTIHPGCDQLCPKCAGRGYV